MRILFSGPLWAGSTSQYRLEAFTEIGHDVRSLDYSPYCLQGNHWLRAMERRLFAGPGIARYNRRLLAETLVLRPDIIWIEKGIYVWPRTLKSLRSVAPCALVHYSPDDHLGHGLHYELLLKSLDLYDVLFTTKTFNIPELTALGARRVCLSANAFAPVVHHPFVLTPEEQRLYSADVCFIGRWEPDREAILSQLATRGYAVKIWGSGWPRLGNGHPLCKSVQYRSVFGDAYPKAILGGTICLNVLSKWYRDEDTTRSVEIPACGGFMLAERTARHLAYFAEGQEAEFFASTEELETKVRRYTSDPVLREKIASAGRLRCLQSDYTYRRRMQAAMEYLLAENLVNNDGATQRNA